MYQVFRPVVLSCIDVVTEGFNRGFVGAFQGAVGLRMEGSGHAEMNIEFLEQFLPGLTHK